MAKTPAKAPETPEQAGANKLAAPEPENTVIPKPSPDPWSSVRVAESIEELDKLKALIYGPNGSGKSSLAARFKRPLIGLTEKQAIPAIKDANPNALIKLISNAQQLLEFRQLTRSPQLRERCDAVALDSLTDIQRVLKDLYTGQQEKNRDITDMQSWGKTIDATARLARELRDLPIHTMIICLDTEIEIDGEGLVHRPAVSGKSLPNQLGQYFNLVGYMSRQVRPGGMRREVMFQGSDRYQTKGMRGLGDVEPPEPLFWLHKRFGLPLEQEKDRNGETVEQRIAQWKACAEENASTQPSDSQSAQNTTNAGTVDPFAGSNS